ncbi:MAG: Interrane phospholipid transport system binding protein MlaC [Pseudomonadota bacterium]|jgi:phospholipid transport system substrate-binding protein
MRFLFPFCHARLCAAMLGLLLLTPGIAAQSTPEAGAEALVRATSDAFFARLKQDEAINAANPANLLATAEELVLPHLNFIAMSQRALGRHWKTMTDAQKGSFVREFRTMLLRTYAKTVNDHRNASVNLKPERRLSDKVSRIRTEVSRSGDGPPFLIDYEMHLESSGWKAYDVTLDGVSLVVSYRAGFNQDIGRIGIDGVIEQLKTRNQKPF